MQQPTVKLFGRPKEIRSRRLAQAMQRKELVARSGLSPNLVALLELEERPTRPETIRALADALGCEPQDISEVRDVEEISA